MNVNLIKVWMNCLCKAFKTQRSGSNCSVGKIKWKYWGTDYAVIYKLMLLHFYYCFWTCNRRQIKAWNHLERMRRSAFSHILLCLILHSSSKNAKLFFFPELYRATDLSQFLQWILFLFSYSVLETQEKKAIKHFTFRYKLSGVKHGLLQRGKEVAGSLLCAPGWRHVVLSN